MAPSIQPATAEHQSEIRALIFSILDEYGLEPAPKTIDSDLDDIIAFYDGGFFDVLISDDGAIIGTVGLKPMGEGVAELRKMYLKQKHRGRGLGKRLLKHAIKRAKALGFRRIELETAGVLREALGLYEAFGFQPADRASFESRCDQALALSL